MHALSVGECISFAWETFKKRPWLLIGAVLLAIVISSLPSLFGPQAHFDPDGKLVPPPVTPAYVIASLASVVISIYVALGLATFSLRAHDNIETAQIADLWNPAPFWRFLGAHILTAIAVGLGFIALVVPGIIIAVGLEFVPYVVIERGLGPIDSIKEAWQITKGHKWQLFLLLLALLGLNFLGAVALVIGLLVTIPISLLALAHAYRTLTR